MAESSKPERCQPCHLMAVLTQDRALEKQNENAGRAHIAFQCPSGNGWHVRPRNAWDT